MKQIGCFIGEIVPGSMSLLEKERKEWRRGRESQPQSKFQFCSSRERDKMMLINAHGSIA